jgi:hypothetical protein
MDRHQRELGLMLGVKAIGILIVGYLAWWGITSFQGKEDSWPPGDAADEDRIIARYKQRLQIGDTPVSSLTPEQAATFLGRIIDHAVKKGDLKTAREYAGQAVDRKMDAAVEKHIGQSAARDLLAQTLSGRVKRDDLQRVADTYAKRPPDSAAKDVRDKFNREFDDQVREFMRTPFRASDCPELAAEIIGIYQSKLAPHKADPRLKAVTVEVEQNCTPPKS